ncbi:MAG: hypothetical protein HY247_04605 [archaeon]|nr:MAG: hypothetical protein HY247_04605 [archaeon]
MTIHGKRLAVAIPDTVLEEKGTERDKTAKLGLVARACSIYGVDLIEIFADKRGRGEGILMSKVLTYLETPQYLRKRLFPLDEALRYAGVLPPLRIPSHRPRVAVEDLKVGEVREGVTNTDGSVEIGLDKAPLLPGSKGSERRVTVRITSKSPLSAEEVKREEISEYWGYEVRTTSAEKVLEDPRFDLTIATSRKGTQLGAGVKFLRERLGGSSGIKLVFGSPARGLFESMGQDTLRRASIVLNLFPEQSVGTIRTEEAIFAGLGLLNDLMA